MAQPQWITTASNLGTIPQLEYYEFLLDAVDPTGGGLVFSLVSGKLPKGLHIIPSGKIQGIPVINLADGMATVTHRFTIRAKNSDKQVADRTFSISVTDVSPPIIIPKNIDLGMCFDGILIDLQLQAIDQTPGAIITWKLTSGTLPKGLTLFPNGRLLGYLQSNSAPGPGSDPGWDDSAWDLIVTGEQLGWDFPIDLVSQRYTFTLQANDGVFTDISTYQILVFPRQDFLITNSVKDDNGHFSITVDATIIPELSVDFTDLSYLPPRRLTAAESSRHYPIILTTQDDLVPVRQNSYFAFQFTAIDLDDDKLKFAITTTTHTGFDELNIGYDTTKFSQEELSIPGGQLVASTTYIAAGSSDTIFKVADMTGVYAGLLVTMGSGLGGNRTVVQILDDHRLILSKAPDSTLVDGDQVIFVLNSQLTLDENTGWLTGRLPAQTINEVIYEFEIVVYKRDHTEYDSRQIYQLSVHGDLSDTVNWVTPTHLGSIQNGTISEFSVVAKSTYDKYLYYSFTPMQPQRLPQGLSLSPNGLIYGKASFEVFVLDSNTTIIDGGTTSIDAIYEFSVTASNLGSSLAASKTFTIQVITKTFAPYENLYLTAMPNQRAINQLFGILGDQTVFEPALLYRNNDPYFGLAKDIKFLFLPGLEAVDLMTYAQAIETNHFKKRLTFGNIKTAIALDDNFNIQYEVVYLEMNDPSSNAYGGAPPNTIDLTKIIKNPYYTSNGASYTIAYPNGFNNMIDSVLSTVDYENKGALPRWMTSHQIGADSSLLPPLGLTHGFVLCYTLPNASAKIAYNLTQKNVNFNSINFTVDKYQIENNSKFYDTTTKKYLVSRETTFNRLVSLGDLYTDKGQVEYAVSTPFDRIHNMSVTEIQQNGGLDGFMDFNDGDYLIFRQQEFFIPIDQYDVGVNFGGPINFVYDYNHGWTNVSVIWDTTDWAFNTNTLDNDNMDPAFDLTPGQAWNKSNYIAGYMENILDPTIINQRIGKWRVNIDSNNFVTLTFVEPINFFDKLFVRNGNTQSGNTLFFDPTIYSGHYVPGFSLLSLKRANNNGTTFDANSTRFLTNRDVATVPGVGDKYIEFTKLNVFT